MNTLNDYEKTCPVCETAFTANRLNQVYCTLRCKNFHNNDKNRQVAERTLSVAGPINSILWKNREILRHFFPNKKAQIGDLIEAGFLTRYITEFRQADKQKSPDLFCYDYGYRFLSNDIIELIKN